MRVIACLIFVAAVASSRQNSTSRRQNLQPAFLHAFVEPAESADVKPEKPVVLLSDRKHKSDTENLNLGATWVALIVITAVALKVMAKDTWTPNHRAPYTAVLLILWTVVLFATIFYFLNSHDWSWLECLYFCVVTITTVGYGDYVPYGSPLSSWVLVFFLWFNMLVLSIVLSIVVNSADSEIEGGSNAQGVVFHAAFLLVLMVGGGCLFMYLEDWTFIEGIFFTTVTLTTVGYGQLLPNSGPASMICAMIFMLVGVPITGCFVGSLGGHLDDCFKVHKDKLSNGVKFLVYVALIIGWLLLGTTLFHQMNSHGWDWAECLYFAAVTMTTVGYGDYVPAKTSTDRILCILFIWASVVVIATVFGDLNGMLIDMMTQGMTRHKAVLTQIATLGVVICAGMATFASVEGWEFLKGLVFTSVTCTTVGYGHYLPNSDAAKLACVPFVLIAVPLTGSLVGHLSDKYSDEIGTLIADVK